MIARDLAGGRTLLIKQQDHADLAAQFAAHWGNGAIAPLDPSQSMVFATAHHDDHYREIECDLPIDPKFGRPYGHRFLPKRPEHLEALSNAVDWLEERDPYAALMMSMHHTGLPQNRYGVIKAWSLAPGGPRSPRALSPEHATHIQRMEKDQASLRARLDISEEQVMFNYRLLQTFDLLSLFFCGDGFVDGALRAAQLEQIPVAFRSKRDITLSITPQSDGAIRFAPYPFDCRPLKVTLPGRIVAQLTGRSDDECRAEFWRAPREILSWTMTD